MSPSFKLQCHFILIFLMALRGENRYLELREAADHDPFLLFGASLKRELAGAPLYRRALRCLDMLSLPGQFTFTADRPQLHCAAFLIAEPEEFITIRYDLVSIDCQGGDFLKVFDGWILKGEKFPSSQDHPLPTTERYIDFCDSGLSRRSIRSSQNVAMIFFRVHEPGNGFTFTIKTDPNLFPCNVISQTPSGRFTLVVPHLRQNCSFSIIYPVAIKISDLTLGHLNGMQFKNPSAGCGGIGDFVELLGGPGLDPSKMMPLADLCYSFHGPAQMKIGCDNTVVRMVSSGNHINRVTFEYRQLEPYELENPSGNSIQEICLSSP
ncbi:corticotropin-releasing factor-binding protein isoform X1 [Zalophus californianus]|uniref:Corticotropin-releasing factor-binding protein n=2 Tax=Zalophus californianus TaxID=9704 RepID=A0A6J2E266_ZALCA|nr:corticotropin-releasing factor-binding protein isoform X1 [Zalophus californianus]XP_027970389.1 corticotropin-releasing factor-binding protein [Eumetopias jubatus]